MSKRLKMKIKNENEKLFPEYRNIKYYAVTYSPTDTVAYRIQENEEFLHKKAG